MSRLFSPWSRQEMPKRSKQSAFQISDQNVEPSEDNGPVAPPAPLADFASWIIEFGCASGLTRRELWLEYGEFCLYSHTEQLTEGQFFRRIKSVGFERYRKTTGKRPWLYRIRKAQVVQLEKHRATA